MKMAKKKRRKDEVRQRKENAVERREERKN